MEVIDEVVDAHGDSHGGFGIHVRTLGEAEVPRKETGTARGIGPAGEEVGGIGGRMGEGVVRGLEVGGFGTTVWR